MTKFGILLSFQAPPSFEPTPQQVYNEAIEQAVAAEDFGFDSVWVTEHHFQEDSYLASPIAACAAIAARTKRVRIGQSVLLLPLTNPVRLAEDIATIDLISNGRVELGIGMGYRDSEFHGLGIDRARRKSLFEENLEIVRRAWTEEEFDFDGKNWTLRGVKMTPKPVQKPHPPIWFGGKSVPGYQRAARNNSPFLLGMLATIEETAAESNAYRAMLDEAGFNGRDAKLALLREMWVADSDDAAWEEINKGFTYIYKSTYNPSVRVQKQGPNDVIAAYYDGDRRIESDDDPFIGSREFRKDRVIHGDPSSVAAEIRRYVDRLGIDEMICRFQLPGVPHAKVVRAMERFASEVRPLLD